MKCITSLDLRLNVPWNFQRWRFCFEIRTLLSFFFFLETCIRVLRVFKIQKYIVTLTIRDQEDWSIYRPRRDWTRTWQ